MKEEVNVEIGKPEYLLDLTFIIPDGTPCMVFKFLRYQYFGRS